MSQENVELVRSISAAHKNVADYGSAGGGRDPDIEYIIAGRGSTAGKLEGSRRDGEGRRRAVFRTSEEHRTGG